MAEQVGSNGNSQHGAIWWSTMGVQKRPAPPMPISSWSSTQGTSASSCHQSGMLCTQALQVTQPPKSSTGDSGEDVLLSSSPELSAGPWRKQLTSGPNSSRASRLKSREPLHFLQIVWKMGCFLHTFITHSFSLNEDRHVQWSAKKLSF